MRRGLIRIWLIASLAWLASMAWRGDFSCFFGSYPWCGWWVVSPWWQSTYLEVFEKAFGVPLLVLITGTALRWAVRGFRSPN
jgi:hypothetical protein